MTGPRSVGPPTSDRRSSAGAAPDRGSVLAETTLVVALVAVLLVALLQLALALHVRNTLIMCASEGARVAARAGAAPDDGRARTTELIATSLGSSRAADVTVRHAEEAGIGTVVVVVTAPLPVMGLLGPAGGLRVTGRAVAEETLYRRGMIGAVRVSPATVRASAARLLDATPRPDQVSQWALGAGTGTPDEASAVVELSGVVQMPLFGGMVSAITGPVTITVTSRARAQVRPLTTP